MSTATIYDVRVRYSVDGRAASANTSRLITGTRQLDREVGRVTGSFRRLGAAVVAAFSLRAGASALIGFNSTVEDTKNQIAGMLALTKKTDLSDELANADKLFSNLQRRAKTLPGTTQEYTRMAGMLTQPISDAGGTLKDLENLTVNSVVAAKALGYQWDLAARDIDQALRGQFHATDPFAGKLLGSIGYKGEEGRSKFNALAADKRFAEIQRALMQKQITQLAAAQGQTFSGAWSTFKDTIEQTLGKIGLPLFRAVTAELKNWNSWADKNGDKIEAFAKTFADGLVTGFHVVKDVLGFLVSHADLLITVAKAWAAVKIGGMLFGGAGRAGSGLVGGITSALGFMRGPRDTFNKETGAYEYTGAGRGRQALTGAGVVSNLGMLGQAFGVGAAIGHLLNEQFGISDSIAGVVRVNGQLLDATDATTKKFITLQRSMDALDAAVQRSRGKEGTLAGTAVVSNLAGLKAQKEQELNVIGDMFRALESGDVMTAMQKRAVATQLGLEEGDLTKEHMAELSQQIVGLTGKLVDLKATGGAEFTGAFLKLTDYQQKTLDVAKAQQESLSYIQRQLATGQPIDQEHVLDILRGATSDPSGKHKSVADKPKVNVTIQRIEVASDDPDRFAFGLVEAFRSAAKNPSSALATLREG